MTTSTDIENDDNHGPSEPPWMGDTLGDTTVEDGEPHFTIQDISFDEAYIKSDTTKRLDKME